MTSSLDDPSPVRPSSANAASLALAIEEARVVAERAALSLDRCRDLLRVLRAQSGTSPSRRRARDLLLVADAVVECSEGLERISAAIETSAGRAAELSAKDAALAEMEAADGSASSPSLAPVRKAIDDCLGEMGGGFVAVATALRELEARSESIGTQVAALAGAEDATGRARSKTPVRPELRLIQGGETRPIQQAKSAAE